MTTAVQLAPAPVFKAFDNSGNPLFNGLLYSYVAGSSTPQATYVDSTGTTPNTNPVVLNARGEANVWLAQGLTYKLTLTDALGNQIWSVDQISGGAFAAIGQNILPSVTNTYTLGNASDSWANLYLGANASPALDTTNNAISYYPKTSSETLAGITPTSFSHDPMPVYDMARYGVIAGAGVDNTAIVQAVFNMCKVSGGTMSFPTGDYAFYLDVSGTSNALVYIEGNGSTFRPATTSPTNSCILFANNSGSTQYVAGSWYQTNVQIRNVTFSARLYTTSSGTGDVNYCVQYNGASGIFYNCIFGYGKVCSVYALYGQYSEFWSCLFAGSTGTTAITLGTAAASGQTSNTIGTAWALAPGLWPVTFSSGEQRLVGFIAGSTAISWSGALTLSGTTAATVVTGAGLVLDSQGLATATTEVQLARCKFQVSSNGVMLKGAQLIRFHDCNIQGIGTGGGQGGILIMNDNTGSFSGGTVIKDCWFEVNSVSHIVGQGATGTLIDGNIFWATGGINSLNFGNTTVAYSCYDLKIVNNSWLGGGTPLCSIVHPVAQTDVATLTWRGNGIGSGGPFAPTTLSLAHNGATYIDMHVVGSFTGTLTGCTTSPTVTINYTIEGDCVDLKLVGLTATSNTTACTITGAPAVIWPQATRYSCSFNEDAGVGFNGNVDITTGGIIDLYKNGSTTGFTASGTKGIIGGVFRYQLFN